MLTGGIDNTWNRLESAEGVVGVGPYPSAQGARWGPEGRKIRVISYMGAAMASFLYGFFFIYNGWGWGYQGLRPYRPRATAEETFLRAHR